MSDPVSDAVTDVVGDAVGEAVGGAVGDATEMFTTLGMDVVTAAVAGKILSGFFQGDLSALTGEKPFG